MGGLGSFIVLYEGCVVDFDDAGVVIYYCSYVGFGIVLICLVQNTYGGVL